MTPHPTHTFCVLVERHCLCARGRYELHGDRGFFSGAAMSLHSVGTGVGALQGAVSLYSEYKLRRDGVDSSTYSDPAALQASLYKIMAMDIEITVGRAAMLCLHDTSVSQEVRRQRAAGLVVLGRIFQGKPAEELN